MRLYVLSLLALTTGLVSCDAPVHGPELLNQAGQTAKSVLAELQSFAGFTADDATRLVQTCDELKRQSPDDWKRYCDNNPAYKWAKQNSAPEPKPGGGGPSPKTGPTEEQKGPGGGRTDPKRVPANEVRHKEQVEALVADVKSSSVRWAQNASAGNLEAKSFYTSKLKVLFEDLKECAGPAAAALLPESHLGLVPPDQLLKAADELNGRREPLQDLHALFGDPEVEKSIETLDAQIRELRAVAASPRTGTFHQARDELASKLSESKAKELAENRPKKLEASWKRDFAVLKAEYPASELSVLADVPSDLAKIQDSVHGMRQSGLKALDVVRAYEPDRQAWLRTTSTLMAEHATIFANQPNRPEFHSWWASRLPQADLEAAWAYARAIVVPETELVYASMNANGVLQGYISGIVPALKAEMTRRKSGGKRDAAILERAVDPTLVDEIRLRLSLDRWGSLRTMPPAIRNTAIVAIEREDRARAEEALSLHANLMSQERKVENQPRALQAALRRQIREGRNRLLVLLTIREQIQQDRAKSGWPQKSPHEDRLSAILASLRLDPPDEDLGLAVVSVPPKDPKGGGGGAFPRGPPEYPLRDPRLFSAEVQLRNSLTAIQEATRHLPDPVYAFASDMGRWNLSQEDALLPKPGREQIVTKSQESRRLDSLKTWKGWVGDDGVPLSAQSVKDGKYLKNIPGGIVMVSTALPTSKKDFSSFILTYDWKTNRLALVGPRSETYYSEKIGPQTLKAINVFVSSGQTIAASIGWSGKTDDLDRSKGDAVLLDPAFVDTTVGQDLVRADSVPWEFRRLQFGKWRNSMAEAFGQEYDAWLKSLALDLTTYLAKHPADADERAEQLRDLRRNKDLLQQKLRGCVVEPKMLALLVDLFQAQYSSASRDSLLLAVDQEVFRRKTLATLYDDHASFGLSPGRITLDSVLGYRYVTSNIVYGEDGVRFAECLQGKDDVVRIYSLEKTVNENVAKIIENFPAIKNVRDYGRVAAFLRWAREPKRLLAVDFYSLTREPGHDPTKTPTPDMILR